MVIIFDSDLGCVVWTEKGHISTLALAYHRRRYITFFLLRLNCAFESTISHCCIRLGGYSCYSVFEYYLFNWRYWVVSVICVLRLRRALSKRNIVSAWPRIQLRSVGYEDVSMRFLFITFISFVFYFVFVFVNVCGSNLISGECLLSQIDRYRVARRADLISDVHSSPVEPLQYQHQRNWDIRRRQFIVAPVPMRSCLSTHAEPVLLSSSHPNYCYYYFMHNLDSSLSTISWQFFETNFFSSPSTV